MKYASDAAAMILNLDLSVPAPQMLTVKMRRVVRQQRPDELAEAEVEEERAAVATGPCTYLCDFKV